LTAAIEANHLASHPHQLVACSDAVFTHYAHGNFIFIFGRDTSPDELVRWQVRKIETRRQAAMQIEETNKVDEDSVKALVK
jgi:hypothetical protein